MVRLFRTYDSRRSQPDGDGLVHPIGDHMSALPGRTYWRGPTSSSVLAALSPKANMQDGTQFDWVMETLFDDHLRAWVRLRTVISVQGFSGLGRRSSVHRRTHAWIGEENSFSSVEGFRFRKFWPAKRRGFSWSEPQVPKSPKKSASRDPPLRRLFFLPKSFAGVFFTNLFWTACVKNHQLLPVYTKPWENSTANMFFVKTRTPKTGVIKSFILVRIKQLILLVILRNFVQMTWTFLVDFLLSIHGTLPETNLAPENRPPIKGDSYWKQSFLGAMLVFRKSESPPKKTTTFGMGICYLFQESWPSKSLTLFWRFWIPVQWRLWIPGLRNFPQIGASFGMMYVPTKWAKEDQNLQNPRVVWVGHFMSHSIHGRNGIFTYIYHTFYLKRTTIHVGTYTSPHSWYMCLTLAKTPSKRNPCDFSPRFGETCWEFKGDANLMPWNNSHLGCILGLGWCQPQMLHVIYTVI